MEGTRTIIIEGTPKSPQVDFNALTGNLILSGKSIPENAGKLYEPLHLWTQEYIKNPRPVTNFRINLEYFNTASTIWLAKIIRTLSRIRNPEAVLLIHLYIDMDDTDTIDADEVGDIIGSLVDNIHEVTVSVGLIIYGLDETGQIVKESKVFI